MEKITTKEEAKAHILGRIAGLNDARTLVWGIGFDKDKTAQIIRKYTTDEIFKLKEILDIENFGDSMFESAVDLLKKK